MAVYKMKFTSTRRH